MKRICATVFAILLTVTIETVNVFAGTQNVTGLTGSDIAVNANYINGSTDTPTYSADVTWGKMSFTYTKTGENVWNAENHSYTQSATGAWTAAGNTVTVVNHSNAKLKVDFTYANVSGVTTVTGTFSVPADTLDAGIEGGYAAADSVTTILTLAGTLPASYDTASKVGTVTVTLGAVAQ